jgi:hypothetical protein
MCCIGIPHGAVGVKRFSSFGIGKGNVEEVTYHWWVPTPTAVLTRRMQYGRKVSGRSRSVSLSEPVYAAIPHFLHGVDLIEQPEPHVLFRFLLFFLLRLFLWSLTSRRRTASSSGWSSGSVRIRVLDAVFELRDSLPLILGLECDGDQVLVAVDNTVHDTRQGGEVGREGDGGDGGDCGREGLEQLRFLNVQHAGSEGLALVINLRYPHAVSEGRDVEHVQEGCFGRSDLGARLDELQIRRDFDGTTGDLGWDAEGLEERGLAGLHTSVASRDVHIRRGDGTGTSGRSNTIGEDLVASGLEVSIGEDEADVALDKGEKTFVLGRIGDEGLESAADLQNSHTINNCANIAGDLQIY